MPDQPGRPDHKGRKVQPVQPVQQDRRAVQEPLGPWGHKDPLGLPGLLVRKDRRVRPELPAQPEQLGRRVPPEIRVCKEFKD